MFDSSSLHNLSITDALLSFSHALAEPLYYISSPEKRIYWLFLLSSSIMALLFSWLYRRKYGIKHAFIDLINPSALFSRSTQQDIALLITNHVLRVLLFLPLIGGQIAVALWVSRHLTGLFGSGAMLELNALHLAVLYTCVFFIIDDLSRFLLHMLMHKIPLLWHFHRVHHNAETLTPLTLYRFHPVETFLLTGRSVITGGLVSGIFVYAFAGQITGWDILGVNAIGFIFNALGANLRHSHIPLSFGRLETWFISPAQHQLHHSKAHIDINFGTYIALWDKLFGSWVKGSPHQKLEFGIKQPSSAASTLQFETP